MKYKEEQAFRRELRRERAKELAENKRVKLIKKQQTKLWKKGKSSTSLKWARGYRITPRRPLVKKQEKKLNKKI